MRRALLFDCVIWSYSALLILIYVLLGLKSSGDDLFTLGFAAYGVEVDMHVLCVSHSQFYPICAVFVGFVDVRLIPGRCVHVSWLDPFVPGHHTKGQSAVPGLLLPASTLRHVPFFVIRTYALAWQFRSGSVL